MYIMYKVGLRSFFTYMYEASQSSQWDRQMYPNILSNNIVHSICKLKSVQKRHDHKRVNYFFICIYIFLHYLLKNREQSSLFDLERHLFTLS